MQALEKTKLSANKLKYKMQKILILQNKIKENEFTQTRLINK